MTREQREQQKLQRQRQQERRQHAREMERSFHEAAKGPMDLPYFCLVVVLTAIGLIMLLSASFPSAFAEGASPFFYFKRQALFAAMGLAGMILVSKINYQRLRGLSRVGLIVAVAMLILVVVPGVGITRNNATRWLGIPNTPLQGQPSEVAKLAVILFFSDSISKKKDKMRTWRYGILPYVATLALMSVLLMMEPHLSGTVLILTIGAVLMIVGGISGWLVGLGVAGAIAAVVGYIKLVGAGIIKYGASRISMWRDPFNPEWFKTDGWQLAQSQLAIGSGGLLGVGLGKSRQKFLYLPEEHNDFIFAVICEELGYLGAGLIMLLFMALILRGFWIALHARDRFGSLLVVGVTTHIALQTALNIAVVTGLAPTTGISLPFFSYGGTALLMQLVEMGVVLSVSRQMRAPKAG